METPEFKIGVPNQGTLLSPDKILTGVSHSDVANLIRIKQVDTLNDQIVRLQNLRQSEVKEFCVWLTAEYSRVVNETLALINALPTVKSLNLRATADPILLDCELKGGKVTVWWVKDSSKPFTKGSIPLQEWFIPHPSGWVNVNVRFDGHARFVVNWEDESADSLAECKRKVKKIEVGGGSVVVRIPKNLMPAWDLLSSPHVIGVIERLTLYDNQIAEMQGAVDRLIRPGAVEAAMTEQILKKSGVDVTDLANQFLPTFLLENR